MAKITIRGVTYPSVREAARQLDLSHATLIQARKEGRLDTVGLNPNRCRKKNQPVTLDGVTYPTAKYAAYELGITPKALSMRLSRRRANVSDHSQSHLHPSL